MHKLPEEGTYVILCQASTAPPPVSTLEGIHRLATVQAINPRGAPPAALPQKTLCSVVTSRNCFTSHIITRAAAAAVAAVCRMLFCVTSGEGIFHFSETTPPEGEETKYPRGIYLIFTYTTRGETPPGGEGKNNPPTRHARPIIEIYTHTFREKRSGGEDKRHKHGAASPQVVLDPPTPRRGRF